LSKPSVKTRLAYVCNACGASLNKWAGRCPECGAWNSIEEIPELPAAARGRQGYAGRTDGVGVLSLEMVSPEREIRTSSGIAELDRVLGGGLVAGSVVLIGGDPGIGKSTLLLQACAALGTGPSPDRPILYVTGEESPQQVSLRSRRLGLSGAGIRLLAETGVERILAAADSEQPQVLVVDSIQTLSTDLLPSAPGSVSQVRETAAQLVRWAKQSGTCVFLIGHVTKEGALAGPRVLEHMVDTVLYFEGEPGSPYRLVRAVKNRFGAVNELGVFAMTDRGLKEVRNPSAIFLSRHDQPVSGSLIVVTREGTRPLMIEVQALVDESPLANPRRVALGLEQNRLSMLLAVLHRHGGVAMFDRDVFVNVVGGVRITETAADLGVLLAVLSSYRDRPLDLELAVFGEVGLSGEIRPVPNGPDRLREAAKHGIRRIIAPKGNVPKGGVQGLEILEVRHLREAIDGV
jgi:DNA repair protein RadA/Sms